MRNLQDAPVIQLFMDDDTCDSFKAISLMSSFPLQTKKEKVPENENED